MLRRTFRALRFVGWGIPPKARGFLPYKHFMRLWVRGLLFLLWGGTIVFSFDAC